MATKIEKQITAYEVVKPEAEQTEATVTQIAPLLERDDVLEGTTYKIKTPLSEHALYITINDVMMKRGEPDEHKRPFEIFINSKNMENFSWIVALTRVISAVFRKGGDVTFLVEELKAVFDPRGGYYKKGGKYMPSLVAEIGEVIQQHMISIGMMEGHLATPELEAKRAKAQETLGEEGMRNAHCCPKCNAKALVRLDNCDTCLECGHSKCG
ncbi:MAG: TSCPD domain-containing protein [Mariprofundaceae bacterium]|nr:TSCPD domain-containing protein [Mariprofundaceae bacterium]